MGTIPLPPPPQKPKAKPYMCLYCGGPLGSEDARCPHCGAPTYGK